MRIRNVRWRNFTSWGNAWHEMNFDGDPLLCLLCGENGSGKSSIPNMIVYMLYGQVDGFTQKDIPNRVNKHFEGFINVESDGHSVMIHRGLMPNIFEVTVDGNPVDTAGKTNIQKYLENEIYKTPYNIFKNSIALSINDFKSFVKMTPKDKSEIIDRIFGYSILNTALAKSKESVKMLKSRIETNEASIEASNASISEIEGRIKELKENRDTDTEDTESGNRLREIDESLSECTRKYGELINAINTLEDIKSEKLDAVSNARYELKGVTEKLGAYEKGICPLCGSRLDTETHKGYANNLRLSSEKLSSDIIKYGRQVNKVDEKISLAVSKQNIELGNIDRLKSEKAYVESGMKHKVEGYEEQLENLRNVSDGIRSRIAPKKSEISKDCKRLDLMNIVCGVFSNDGLKQYISDIYVPLINGYVEGVCSQLGISYRIVFDTGYNCTIWSLGEEVSYTTLSNGERKKIDIAVTLAFLQIIKTKVSDINVLFLDEVLSSIDVGSCNEMLKIFKTFASDNGVSIYMVHHANLDSTYVDKVIEVEKRNGFSNFITT